MRTGELSIAVLRLDGDRATRRFITTAADSLAWRISHA
jgi:hypothetical protein